MNVQRLPSWLWNGRSCSYRSYLKWSYTSHSALPDIQTGWVTWGIHLYSGGGPREGGYAPITLSSVYQRYHLKQEWKLVALRLRVVLGCCFAWLIGCLQSWVACLWSRHALWVLKQCRTHTCAQYQVSSSEWCIQLEPAFQGSVSSQKFHSVCPGGAGCQFHCVVWVHRCLLVGLWTSWEGSSLSCSLPA